jgi:hypothetical protein
MSGKAFLKPEAAKLGMWAVANSAFKLNRFLSTAWEWTPFSFVADWFLHIDRGISRLEDAFYNDSPFDIENVKDLCFSRKRVAQYDLYHCSTNVVGQNWNFPNYDKAQCIGSVYDATYDRNSFDVLGGTAVRSDGLSFLRKLISGALIVQQLNKRPAYLDKLRWFS